MKREFLKGLGLTDEQIEQIMAENGKDVQAEIDKAVGLTTERDSLKQQLKDRDKDIADLKKQTGSDADLQKQLDDLQAKYKTDTESLNQQLSDQRLDAALDSAIHGARGRNGKAIKALLDRSKLKLKDDGTVEGLDLEALKTSTPYLFEIETKKDEGSDPGSGAAAGGSGISQDLFNKNINNPDWINQNWDAVSQGLANGTITKG